MTPFESGAITLVCALGAMGSKCIAEKVYSRWGFPRVLGVSAVLGGLLIGAQGVFTAETAAAVMLGVIVFGGVLRSIFFTGSNALGYADISDEEASQATAIVAVSQQLSVAFGVAVAGAVIEITRNFTGGELTLLNFQIAFFTVGALSAL